MKLRCDRGELVDRLGVVSRAALGRGQVTVLTGIRLRALADRLVLAATDTEIALEASVAADVAEEGAAVAPARPLVELVRKLPPEPVDLRADETAVHVSSGESDYRLNALSALDFPELPHVDAAPLEVGRGAFAAAYARVARAVARDASRPVYTGVLVGLHDGVLTMVAMDGHRLAVSRAPVAAADELPPTLIPARALAELARLPAGEDALEAAVSENHVLFASGGYRLTTRRLAGRFQPWEQLLAADFAYEATIDRDLLLEAVDRAAVVVQRNAPIMLDFRREDVVLHVTTAEVGNARERIPLASNGAEAAVALNARYLLDGLQTIDGDTVRVRAGDPLRPVVLSGAGDEQEYLVAPVRRPG